jgi:hypothetical protein
MYTIYFQFKLHGFAKILAQFFCEAVLLRLSKALLSFELTLYGTCLSR